MLLADFDDCHIPSVLGGISDKGSRSSGWNEIAEMLRSLRRRLEERAVARLLVVLAQLAATR